MSEASSDDRDGLASLASSPASSGGLRSLDVSDADDAASNDDHGPVPLVVRFPRTLYEEYSIHLRTAPIHNTMPACNIITAYVTCHISTNDVTCMLRVVDDMYVWL